MKNEREEQVKALIARVSKLMAEFNGFVNFYTKREVNSPSNGEILGNCEPAEGLREALKTAIMLIEDNMDTPGTEYNSGKECKSVAAFVDDWKVELARVPVAETPAQVLESASDCGNLEIRLVGRILAAHQTAYAQAHNADGKGVIESQGIAIGYASREMHKILEEMRAEAARASGVPTQLIEKWIKRAEHLRSLEGGYDYYKGEIIRLEQCARELEGAKKEKS